MRDLPRPGIKPMSSALAGGFFTPEPSGKPQICPFIWVKTGICILSGRIRCQQGCNPQKAFRRRSWGGGNTLQKDWAFSKTAYQSTVKEIEHLVCWQILDVDLRGRLDYSYYIFSLHLNYTVYGIFWPFWSMDNQAKSIME